MSDQSEAMRAYIETLCFEKSYDELSPLDRQAVDVLKKTNPSFNAALVKCDGIRELYRQQSAICETIDRIKEQTPLNAPSQAGSIIHQSSPMIKAITSTLLPERNVLLSRVFKDFGFPCPPQ